MIAVFIVYALAVIALLLLGATYLLPLLVWVVVVAFQIAWMLLATVLWGVWLVACCLWFPFDPARARAAMRLDQESILMPRSKRYRHEAGPPLPSIVRSRAERQRAATAANGSAPPTTPIEPGLPRDA